MTLEEAKREAMNALSSQVQIDGENKLVCEVINKVVNYHTVDTVVQALERSGYVLCNKTLTVDQRNKMTDVFHNSFQSMQSVHEAMLKGVK